MNELKSYTEYAVSTPTADFVIGFDFNYGEDAVNVTVDDVPATEAGYTVVYLNETTIRLSPSVPSGVVRLQRETDIDQSDHAYRAGAKFIAQTMDENFEQLRHSQQEVRDGFNKLADDTYEIIDALQEVGQSAQDAADAAEVAAGLANDAAAQVNDKVAKSATVPTYLTVADGVNPVTGVADGAYFNVRSADDDTVAIEYQNVGGVPTPSGKYCPSGFAVESIIKEIGAIKTPVSYNIPESDSVDVTAILAQLMNPSGKHVSMLERRTYLVDELIVPPNTILYANGAIIKRRQGTGKPLVTVQGGAFLIGAIVDGDEDNIGAQLWNGDQGIKLDVGALAFGCVAKNCHGHGFTLFNDAIAIACNSHNHGREGGNGTKWGNWGDGFNMTNSNRSQLLFCRAWGSYRTGIVGTTSAGAPTYEPNPLLSVGISLVGCKAWDNYYSDVNFEGCSKVQVTDLDSKSGITFRITPDMTINGFRGAIIDASDADNATINNVIIDRDNTSSAVYISGKNPKISNITVRGKSGVTQTGIAVQVTTPDGSGSISNIQIDRAFNAVRTNVKNFTAFEYSNVANIVFNYDGRFAVNSGFISVIDGRVSQRTTSLLTPSSGSWLNGDLLINGSSSGDYAVVCTKTGRATNVAWVSGGVAALNIYIYSANNVYLVTTAGTFGTTAPNHTSGTVANGTAQLEYVSARAEFKTIAYKTDPVVGVSAIVPSSITNANDTALTGKFYWVESVLTNMPLPTSGSFTKANIETYNAYRLSGNNALTQEVNYPYLNEKWVRAYDGGIGGWSLWTLVHTKNSSGTTSNRPSGNVPIGFEFFDTTLGKPVYFKSTGVWVDATGVAV